MTSDEIQGVLRHRGYRVTAARRAVWQALTESAGHVTVEDLAARVRRLDPGVNVASVYRSLALFEELDLVRESRLGGEDASRWELAHPDEHFHLVCDVCGGIEHHIGSLVDQIRTHLSDDHGFEPRDIELIVTGRCAACAGRKAAAS